MSHKEFEASRMRRLKRIAGRHGLTTLTAEKLTAKGGHAIREDESHKVIFGDSPMLFSATFEQIEAYVEKLEADEE
ncbi:MAG: hypothetical protein MO852_10860 [Candidatus Devosia euplotis]|nr:hypothetical protein [Candidatus Devosia euplotis]